MTFPESLPQENRFTAIPATLGDLPDLLALEEEAFPTGERWSEDIFKEELARRPEGIKILKDGNKIIGYFEVEHESRDGIHVGDIGSIAVSNDYRGQGIGEYLLKTAISTLKSQGVSLIRAKTRYNNVEMLNLLGRFEFKRVGATPNYYRSGHDSVDFEMRLR
jgi:ribosomal-protein-alanine N-acetyltransferase